MVFTFSSNSTNSLSKNCTINFGLNAREIFLELIPSIYLCICNIYTYPFIYVCMCLYVYLYMRTTTVPLNFHSGPFHSCWLKVVSQIVAHLLHIHKFIHSKLKLRRQKKLFTNSIYFESILVYMVYLNRYI